MIVVGLFCLQTQRFEDLSKGQPQNVGQDWLFKTVTHTLNGSAQATKADMERESTSPQTYPPVQTKSVCFAGTR